MIRKKRRKPIKLLKTDALLRRIPFEHPKWHNIEHDLARKKAGYHGEQALDYHLSFIDRERFLILHDLRLHDKIHYFQIDTLILNPSFFLILEVKNISGTLYFDPFFDQMVRTKNEEEEVFPDPVRQVLRQKSQLSTWLKNRKYGLPPIESVVVISNARTHLRTSPNNKECLRKIIRDTRLVEMVANFEARHREAHFNFAELRKIASQLVRNDTPLDPDVLDQYGIDRSDLITGVCCSGCGLFAMKREWGTWCCPHCGCKSRDAHLAALRDYALLIDSTISNREARDFLRLPTSRIAHNTLQALGVPCVGTTKGTRYNLDKL